MPDGPDTPHPCTKCGEQPADGVYLWCAACRRERETCEECAGNGGCYAHPADISRPSSVTTQPHYAQYSVEPIDAIEAWGLNFRLGNVVKYIARHRRKDGKRDLRKALAYLHREIEGEWP